MPVPAELELVLGVHVGDGTLTLGPHLGLPPAATLAAAPAASPARGAVRVHLAVRRAEVDAPVRHGRVGVEGAGAADPRLRARAPDLLAGADVERVDVRVVGAEVDASAGKRDRSLDQAARVVVPAQVPGRGREGVDVVRPVADDDDVAGEERRALAGAGRPL